MYVFQECLCDCYVLMLVYNTVCGSDMNVRSVDRYLKVRVIWIIIDTISEQWYYLLPWFFECRCTAYKLCNLSGRLQSLCITAHSRIKGDQYRKCMWVCHQPRVVKPIRLWMVYSTLTPSVWISNLPSGCKMCLPAHTLPKFPQLYNTMSEACLAETYNA